MDRLTSIEEEIKTLLLSINKEVQPSGYTQYTNTGTVNIDDEVLSLALNETSPDDDNMSVNYTISIDEREEVAGYNLCQNDMSNIIRFKIHCRAHNHPDSTNPKYDINVQLNEALSDLKQLFFVNWELNKQVTKAQSDGFLRDETFSGNIIMSKGMNFYLLVEYSQEGNNPDNKVS